MAHQKCSHAHIQTSRQLRHHPQTLKWKPPWKLRLLKIIKEKTSGDCSVISGLPKGCRLKQVKEMTTGLKVRNDDVGMKPLKTMKIRLIDGNVTLTIICLRLPGFFKCRL